MPTYMGSQSPIYNVQVNDYLRSTSIVDSMLDRDIVEESELAVASCTLTDSLAVGLVGKTIRWVVTSTVPGFVTQTFPRTTGTGGACVLPIYFDWAGAYTITPYFDGETGTYNFGSSVGAAIAVTVTQNLVATTTALVVPTTVSLSASGVDVTATATVKDASLVGVVGMPVRLWVDTLPAVNGTTGVGGTVSWTIHIAPGAFGPAQGAGVHTVKAEAMEWSKPGTTIRLQ